MLLYIYGYCYLYLYIYLTFQPAVSAAGWSTNWCNYLLFGALAPAMLTGSAGGWQV